MNTCVCPVVIFLGMRERIWLAISMVLNNSSLSIPCWRTQGMDYLYLINLLS